MDAPTPANLLPSEDEIRQQLERTINSASFHSSGRLKDLLKHVVEETLAGRAENLLGKNIQTDVFGKVDPSTAGSSSTVRVEIGRMRRRLHQYYDTDGYDDPVRINVPKGGYAASFEYLNAAETSEAETSQSHKRRFIRFAGTALIVAAMALFFGTWLFSLRTTSDQSTAAPIVAVLPLQRIGAEFPVMTSSTESSPIWSQIYQAREGFLLFRWRLHLNFCATR